MNQQESEQLRVELEQLLDQTIDAVAGKAPPRALEVRPGSWAATIAENHEQRADGSPWGAAPTNAAVTWANRLLMSSIHTVEAIRLVTTREPIPFVGWTLARSLFEQAGLVWWLINDRATPREVAFRAQQLAVTGARESMQALDAIGSTDSGKALDDQLRIAADLGFRVEGDSLVGGRLPSVGDLAKEALTRAGVAKANAIYNFATGFSHGRAFLHEHMHNTYGREAAGVSIEGLATVVAFSVAVFASTADHHFEALGLDRVDGLDDLMRSARIAADIAFSADG